MKLFIAVCIASLGIAIGAPLATVDGTVTANPSVAAAIQAVDYFLSEANILKIVQIFAASSSDAQAILDALQGVENQAFKCLFRNGKPYKSELKNGTSIPDFIQAVASNECSQYATELNALATALESASAADIVSGINLEAYLPASLAELEATVLTTTVQIALNGASEANIDAAQAANVALLDALLNADDATNAALVQDQSYLADIILPNGSYYQAWQVYLQQSIYANAKNASFNITNFIDSSIKIQEWQILNLPQILQYTQNEIDSAVVPADIAADSNLQRAAQRIELLTTKIDDWVSDPQTLNVLNKVATGTFVLPTGITFPTPGSE